LCCVHLTTPLCCEKSDAFTEIVHRRQQPVARSVDRKALAVSHQQSVQLRRAVFDLLTLVRWHWDFKRLLRRLPLGRDLAVHHRKTVHRSQCRV